jgi:hypothetical protein
MRQNKCRHHYLYAKKAASLMQTLHAIAASCMQSRQFFASTLRGQLFELKNEDAIKKSKNLRDTCACQGLSINTMHGPIQSRETVPSILFSPSEKILTLYFTGFHPLAAS